MVNPSPIEAAYDRLDARWAHLPIIREHGRLQAAPFIVVFQLVLAAMFIGAYHLSEAPPATVDAGLRAAIFLITAVSGTFFVIMWAVVRHARRQSCAFDGRGDR